MTTEPSAGPIYRIIRFRKSGSKRTIKSGVTLEEAQEHCGKESTHGPNWFDGYDYIKGYKPREA